MSAATITFGKTIQSREDCLGYRHSWTPVLANGVPVGTIHKDQGRHGTRYVILDHNGKKIQNSDTKASISFLAEKVYIPHPTKPGKTRRVGDDWQTARRNAKAFAKEHFAAIEMPEVIVTDDEIFIRGELVGSIARKDQSRRTAWLDRLHVVTINGVTYEASPARSRDLAIEKATEAAQAETVEVEESAQSETAKVEIHTCVIDCCTSVCVDGERVIYFDEADGWDSFRIAWKWVRAQGNFNFRITIAHGVAKPGPWVAEVSREEADVLIKAARAKTAERLSRNPVGAWRTMI